VTTEEKQIELQRNREILLATIDYFILKHGDSFVLDNQSHKREYYEQQKAQVDKYYKQRRLDKLQQKLASLTKSIENSIDLTFSTYIKKRTGYDIDIFDKLKKRVDQILTKNKIENSKEENDIGTMLHYLIDTSSSAEEVEKLKALLINYHGKNREKQNGYSEVISRVEKDGIVTEKISFSTGPKPKHFNEVEAISPDGKRKLFIVQWSDGTHASTSVTLQFANGASGAIYSTNGIQPDIVAFWSDNSTISIRTKKAYDIEPRHMEVRSFDDCITLQYVDIDKDGLQATLHLQ
jgi:hypothetical protein